MGVPKPKPARLRCDLVFLDPVAAWRALPLRAQEEIGPAAIAMIVALIGDTRLIDVGYTEAARPYATALHDSLEWLDTQIDHWVLGESAEVPPVPDLRPLGGIQQCRGCGCTDTHPCDAGCSWVDEDLCSACAGAPA
jgi:hypothetical protein